eukprot:GEMP01002492.1.p1 GENE.GEMP01002492.1~~GEMP01002492.1.p1  ORF type:complete len:1041 (+),score=304.97 GEMP01002492.1:325-3447(+)
MEKDEVFHKMSKKIAQLTKVIFHLNTKNDENELHIKAVTNAYEQEVDAIVRDANARVQQAREAAEEARTKGIAKQLDTIAEKYERERRLGTQEIMSFREQVGDREQRNVKLWTDKMQDQMSEICDLRSKCIEQKNVFESRAREAEEVRQVDAAKLRQLELERDDLRRSVEQEAQRRLTAERDLEALNNQLRSTANDMAGTNKSLNDLRVKYNDDLALMRKQEAELRKAIGSKDSLLGSHKEQLLILEETKDYLRGELASLTAHQQDLQNVVKNLELELRESTEKLSAAQVQLESEQKRAKEVLEQAKRRWNMEMEALGRQMKADQEDNGASWSQKLQELQQQLDAALQEVSAVRQEKDSVFADFQGLSRDEADTRRKLEIALDEIKASDDEISRLLREIEIQKTQHQVEVGQLAADNLNKEETLKAAFREREQALLQQQDENTRNNTSLTNAQIEKVNQDYADKIAGIRCEHEEALTRLRMSSEAEADRLNAEIKRLEEVIKEHQRSKQEGSSEHTAEMAAMRHLESQLREALEGSKQQCAEQEKSARTTIEELRKALDSANARLAEREDELRKEVSKGVKREDTINRLGNDINVLQKEIDAIKRQFAMEKKQYADMLQSGGLDAQRLATENSSFRATLEEMTNAKRMVDEKLIAEHNRTLEVQAELEETRRQLLQIDAFHDERQRMQQNFQIELTSAKEDAVKMVEQITKEQQEKLSTIFEKHKEQLAQLRETLQKKYADETKAKIAECERRYEEKIRAFEEKIRALEQTHASKIRKLDEDMKAAALQFKADQERAEARWKEQVTSLEKQLAGALVDAKNSDEMLNKKIHEFEKLLREANDRIAVLEREFTELKKSHEHALSECKENYESDLDTQMTRHRVEIEAMNRKHTAEMEELAKQFDEARALQEQQIEMLQQRLHELQELYDTRPSRQEDLDFIDQLETEVREKESAFKQLFDQMQFYKLELVNREQNYNKTFGANPSVGVLNPMAKKNGQARLVQQQALPPLGANGMLNTALKVKIKRPLSDGHVRNGVVNGA